MSKPSHSEGKATTPEAEHVTKSALATVGNQILPFVIGGGSGIVATTCLQPIVSVGLESLRPTLLDRWPLQQGYDHS